MAACDVIFYERLTLQTYLDNLAANRDLMGSFRGNRAFASATDEADWDEQNVDNASEEAGPLPYCGRRSSSSASRPVRPSVHPSVSPSVRPAAPDEPAAHIPSPPHHSLTAAVALLLLISRSPPHESFTSQPFRRFPALPALPPSPPSRPFPLPRPSLPPPQPEEAEQAQRKAGGTTCSNGWRDATCGDEGGDELVLISLLHAPPTPLQAPEFSVGTIAITQLALTPLLPPSQPAQPSLLPAAAPSSLPSPSLPIPGNAPPPGNMSLPSNTPLPANMSLPGNMSLPSLTAPLPANLTLNTAQLSAAVKAAAAAATLPANSTRPASPAAIAATAAASKYLSPLASSPLLTSPLLANANVTINAPSGMTLLGLLAAREAELDAELKVTVVAGNSNHVGISYEYVSITARHLGADVGNASIPAFHQPPRSNTTVEGHVHLTRLPLHLLPPPSSSPLSTSTLSHDAFSAQSTLPLQLAIEARANVDVYNIGTPYIT
ncbi:unnamed protein product, partial [Closterium sp. NIES-54]